MRFTFSLLLVALTVVCGAFLATTARASGDLCLAAVAAVEAEMAALPAGLLVSIALVESAHRPPGERRVVPWPWTINSPAGSFFLADRARAVAKVEELRAAGHRNIDAGCMQVNLHHHPDAFANLEEAFEPASNVRYAARFLDRLRRATPSLFDAVGRYHSATPELSVAYAKRVYARWGKPGVAGDPALTPPLRGRPVPAASAKGEPALATPIRPKRVWHRSGPTVSRSPTALRRGGAADPRILVRGVAP